MATITDDILALEAIRRTGAEPPNWETRLDRMLAAAGEMHKRLHRACTNQPPLTDPQRAADAAALQIANQTLAGDARWLSRDPDFLRTFQNTDLAKFAEHAAKGKILPAGLTGPQDLDPEQNPKLATQSNKLTRMVAGAAYAATKPGALPHVGNPARSDALKTLDGTLAETAVTHLDQTLAPEYLSRTAGRDAASAVLSDKMANTPASDPLALATERKSLADANRSCQALALYMTETNPAAFSAWQSKHAGNPAFDALVADIKGHADAGAVARETDRDMRKRGISEPEIQATLTEQALPRPMRSNPSPDSPTEQETRASRQRLAERSNDQQGRSGANAKTGAAAGWQLGTTAGSFAARIGDSLAH